MLTGDLQILAIPAFIFGILFLYKGSDMLVNGVSKAAAQIGISALIISVLLVGFGTSAPEFAISAGAAIQRNSDISLGNVIGSCIANLVLVLGISSIIRPIKIKKGIIRREMPIVLAATSILIIFSALSLLDKYHLIGGSLFLIFFSLFVLFFVYCARKERNNKIEIENGNIVKNILFIVIGIALVIGGAWLLIESATTIAMILNISPFIIALSMVAVGTSLPELVVSAVAAYRGEADIAVGNVLGSNVFNIFLILGVAALFIPLGAISSIDNLLILLAITIIMVPICCTKHTISRIEGFFMLVIYGIYIWYIFAGSELILNLL
jgi:cation:H+ antiporter